MTYESDLVGSIGKFSRTSRLQIMKQLADDSELLTAVARQVSGNSETDTDRIKDDLGNLKTYLSKLTKQVETLVLQQSTNDTLRSSEVFTNTVQELEGKRRELQDQIRLRQRELDTIASDKTDPHELRRILSDFTLLHSKLEKNEKRRLNHLLFSGIISHLRRQQTGGDIEIRIRADGVMKKTWEDLKKVNRVVRIPGSHGSASRTRTCNPAVNSRMLYH